MPRMLFRRPMNSPRMSMYSVSCPNRVMCSPSPVFPACISSDTLEWVDWFNHRRLSSAIGYVPPAEYEASQYCESVPAPAGTQ